MKRFHFAPSALLVAALAAGAVASSGGAQVTPKPKSSIGRFNLYSTSQDIEIGRQSALEAEKQLPMLNDPRVDSYVNQIVQKLLPGAPGARYPYQAKVVNAPEINAFSLPGGPLYINRGLIEAARSEGELAGVIAHEMAHVALRHGTVHASNSALGQTGLGLLGGLIGTKSSSAAGLVNAIGGVGLNVAFLKFSRDDEYEADRAGAAMMAKAGYSPFAMAEFFGVLKAKQGSEPGKVAQFLSDHPPAADRETRIRQYASSNAPVQAPEIGGFSRIQSLASQSTASTSRSSIWPTEPATPVPVSPQTPVRVRIPAPASRFASYQEPNGLFSVNHPTNWRPIHASGTFAATIAPDAGIVTLQNGQQAIVYGVVINHYAPFEGETSRWESSLRQNYAPFERRTSPRGMLEDATDDLVRSIMRANPYLKATTGSAKAETIDGGAAYSVLLTGISPVTGEEEKVKAFTRALEDNHVIYALCIAPTRDFAALDRTFTRMIRTLMVNEDAVHRAAAVGAGSGQ